MLLPDGVFEGAPSLRQDALLHRGELSSPTLASPITECVDMTHSADPSEQNEGREPCRKLLQAFLEAIRASTPELNDRFALPQRMRVHGTSGGSIRDEGEGACSAEFSVHFGELTRTYELSINLEQVRAFAILRDQEGFVEHFDLTDPLDPLSEENKQAFYEALVVDIASHFGTDS